MKEWIKATVEEYRQNYHLDRWYIDVQFTDEPHILVDRWYEYPDDDVAILRVNDTYPKKLVLDGVRMRMREMAMRYMVVETKRLRIRHIECNDFEAEWKLQSDPMVALMDGYAPVVDERMMVKKMAQMVQHAGSYVVVKKESNLVMGHLSLNFAKRASFALEMGYAIQKDDWNRGYATEAVKGMLAQCFMYLDADMVVMHHFVDNIASKRVMEKNHLQYEGCLRQAYLHDVWGAVDLKVYSMTKSEWNQWV